jgi:simple sugar transport system ATP-binding protein
MSGSASPPPLVALRDITKRFPGVVANDRVNLDLYAGEVHVLLGENGAGKSTLMNVVAGLYQPERGTLLIRGEATRFQSPREAFEHGIGMVHQHFRLVDALTALENIVLGTPGPALSLDLSTARVAVERLGAQYGLEVPLDELVRGLSVGRRQRVEILRLLYRDTAVLIFDEPTAVLTPQEADRLGEMMKQLAAEGRAVITITHKLKEALAVATTITVMRDGAVVDSVPAATADEDQLVEMMIGQLLPRPATFESPPRHETILRLSGVGVAAPPGPPLLENITLSVSSGEIVGIAGVSGNGQRELAEVIAGLRRPGEGEVWVGDRDLCGATPLAAIIAGVSYVPGDRLRVGLVPDLPVQDNIILKRYREPELQNGPFLNRERAASLSRELIDLFDISVPNPAMPIDALSGGNQQKVILARELDAAHRLLVVEHPTRGLDIKASASVHTLLRRERAGGNAILLISSDLDELIALSDRIVVMYEGRLVGEVAGEDANARDLGRLMAGRSLAPDTGDDPARRGS